MIYLGSRYQNEQVQSVADGDKPVRQFVLRTVVPTDDESLRTYTWHEGDRIDVVALRELGSAAAWWRIMDVNPDIMDPHGIEVGTLVRIPDDQ